MPHWVYLLKRECDINPAKIIWACARDYCVVASRCARHVISPQPRIAIGYSRLVRLLVQFVWTTLFVMRDGVLGLEPKNISHEPFCAFPLRSTNLSWLGVLTTDLFIGADVQISGEKYFPCAHVFPIQCFDGSRLPPNAAEGGTIETALPVVLNTLTE